MVQLNTMESSISRAWEMSKYKKISSFQRMEEKMTFWFEHLTEMNWLLWFIPRTQINSSSSYEWKLNTDCETEARRQKEINQIYDKQTINAFIMTTIYIDNIFRSLNRVIMDNDFVSANFLSFTRRDPSFFLFCKWNATNLFHFVSCVLLLGFESFSSNSIYQQAQHNDRRFNAPSKYNSLVDLIHGFVFERLRMSTRIQKCTFNSRRQNKN